MSSNENWMEKSCYTIGGKSLDEILSSLLDGLPQNEDEDTPNQYPAELEHRQPSSREQLNSGSQWKKEAGKSEAHEETNDKTLKRGRETPETVDKLPAAKKVRIPTPEIRRDTNTMQTHGSNFDQFQWSDFDFDDIFHDPLDSPPRTGNSIYSSRKEKLTGFPTNWNHDPITSFPLTSSPGTVASRERILNGFRSPDTLSTICVPGHRSKMMNIRPSSAPPLLSHPSGPGPDTFQSHTPPPDSELGGTTSNSDDRTPRASEMQITPEDDPTSDSEDSLEDSYKRIICVILGIKTKNFLDVSLDKLRCYARVFNGIYKGQGWTPPPGIFAAELGDKLFMNNLMVERKNSNNKTVDYLGHFVTFSNELKRIARARGDPLSWDDIEDSDSPNRGIYFSPLRTKKIHMALGVIDNPFGKFLGYY